MKPTSSQQKTDAYKQSLEDLLRNLDFHFVQREHEAVLQIMDFAPVHFDNLAGGKVFAGSDKWIARKHAERTVHEPSTVAAFAFVAKHFSHRVETVFDIGALYGYFTLLSASMFPGADVFGFEMNPLSYKALCRNINLNNHLGRPAARAVNVGLSDRTALAQRVAIKNFHLDESSASDDASDASVIDVLALDDFCRLSGARPDLIKIDVEGYQAKILPGGANMLKTCKPIVIMEFDGPEQLARFGTTNRQITKIFFDLGYDCYWCRNQRDFEGTFARLDYDSLTEAHELNSLAVFIP